jgi:hypothetical protein
MGKENSGRVSHEGSMGVRQSPSPITT